MRSVGREHRREIFALHASHINCLGITYLTYLIWRRHENSKSKAFHKCRFTDLGHLSVKIGLAARQMLRQKTRMYTYGLSEAKNSSDKLFLFLAIHNFTIVQTGDNSMG